jgi:hypothetical protein
VTTLVAGTDRLVGSHLAPASVKAKRAVGLDRFSAREAVRDAIG